MAFVWHSKGKAVEATELVLSCTWLLTMWDICLICSPFPGREGSSNVPDVHQNPD